jgi:signal transduction histidine kinase
MMLSLRNRLLLGMVAGLTCLLVCSGMLVYIAVKGSLYSQCDAAISATAQMLSASFEQQGNTLKTEMYLGMTPQFQKTARPDYYIIELADGTSSVMSGSLDNGTAAILRKKLKKTGFRTVELEDDHYVRTFRTVVDLRYEADENADSSNTELRPCVLMVARDISELRSHLARLKWILFICGTITVGLSVVVAIGVVDRGLRPVAALASNINNISDESLQMRLGSDAVPPELMPVVNQLNNMLARLEGSFMRQRRFNSDVAHELRTPLSGLSANLEVTLMKLRTAEEYRETISICLPIVHSMQTIVANLLELTRPEGPAANARLEAVRISDIVNICWKTVAAKASARSLSFVNNIQPDLAVPADSARLTMIVSNVLDNAVEYTDAGGRVWTEVPETKPGKIVFSFCNTGSKLAPEEVAQVFDHFWQGDKARTNTGLHCGLGLSIVKKLTGSLGGTVQVESGLDGVFKIIFTFPREAAGT